jgi:hypothetical protein
MALRNPSHPSSPFIVPSTKKDREERAEIFSLVSSTGFYKYKTVVTGAACG